MKRMPLKHSPAYSGSVMCGVMQKWPDCVPTHAVRSKITANEKKHASMYIPVVEKREAARKNAA
jgi:hypothetical protein